MPAIKNPHKKEKKEYQNFLIKTMVEMSSSLWSILGLRLLEAEIALEQRALPQPGVDDLTPCCLVGCRVPSKQKKGCEKAAKESQITQPLAINHATFCITKITQPL